MYVCMYKYSRQAHVGTRHWLLGGMLHKVFYPRRNSSCPSRFPSSPLLCPLLPPLPDGFAFEWGPTQKSYYGVIKVSPIWDLLLLPLFLLHLICVGSLALGPHSLVGSPAAKGPARIPVWPRGPGTTLLCFVRKVSHMLNDSEDL